MKRKSETRAGSDIYENNERMGEVTGARDRRHHQALIEEYGEGDDDARRDRPILHDEDLPVRFDQIFR